jgi:hypothetical protein
MINIKMIPVHSVTVNNLKRQQIKFEKVKK